MKLINRLLIVALVYDLYNNIQISFRNHIQSMWFNTAGMSRMISHTGAFDYTSATNPNNFNFLWTNAYAGMIPDIDALNVLASERGLDFHAGASKIMQAYVLTNMVDLFGNIPLSQTLQGTNNPAPTRDPGADVYAAADALLVEAIGLLSGANLATPANELIYDGDASKWVRLAKTLQLRNAVTTRLVNTSAAATINALVAEGDIISSAADDFTFQYGNTRLNPNSRHPFYNNWYENNDGNYMSNYYMWLLRAEKLDADGNEVRDPRLRYYFYRQNFDAAELDVNVYSCHFSNTPTQDAQPAHYAAIDPRLPYCIAAADGFFGRDHLNNEGIPPDGPLRTTYGVYPAAGRFDDNSFESTQQLGTVGGLGQGIEPLMLSSYVEFLRAEAALTIGTNDDARTLLESGVRSSIGKVISFSGQFMNLNDVIGTDIDGNPILLSALVPSEEVIDEYVALVLANYDAAGNDDERLDVLMKEYYIALFGNGIESYNMWRRTGKPDNMTPSLEPTDPTTFIRSFFLPADHVNFNASASQKSLTEPVFWDTNPAGFAY